MLNLGITFLLPGISIGGHLGGLVAGGIAALLLFEVGEKQRGMRQAALGATILLGAVIAVVCVVYSRSRSGSSRRLAAAVGDRVQPRGVRRAGRLALVGLEVGRAHRRRDRRPVAQRLGLQSAGRDGRDAQRVGDLLHAATLRAGRQRQGEREQLGVLTPHARARAAPGAPTSATAPATRSGVAADAVRCTGV